MLLLKLFKDYLLHKEKMNLWEMANLYPSETGIPNYVVWVSTKEGMRHGPRIKVCKGQKWSNNSATVTFPGIPRIIGDTGITQDEFAEISRWLLMNQDLLLQYWNQELSTKAFVNAIKPLSTNNNNKPEETPNAGA